MMVLPLICGECIKESRESGSMPVDELMVPVAEIQEEPIYEVTCSKGHRSLCLVQNEKFELLFDLGVNGLIDGYYREAVSSFTAALERFYEFFLRIAFFSRTNESRFEENWTHVRNQSERQLGAFIFQYLSETGDSAPVLSEKDISFRNRVIHKGYIPTKNEATEFGEAVRGLVDSALVRMKQVYGEELVKRLEAPFTILAEKRGVRYACTVTPILDVRESGRLDENDVRNLPLPDLLDHIFRRRQPHRMRLFSTREELGAATKQLK